MYYSIKQTISAMIKKDRLIFYFTIKPIRKLSSTINKLNIQLYIVIRLDNHKVFMYTMCLDL